MKIALEKGMRLIENCEVCPRMCRIDRTKGQTGWCGVGIDLLVASCHPHFGEEGVLVGKGGSGTIFFSSCNLGCIFCQNHEISHGKEGERVSEGRLAELMLRLESSGCHNINLVTPTHFTPQIMESLLIAFDEGLKIPVVYNCGGYESVEMLRLLDGFVDIYMPDAKYSDPRVAKELSDAADYFEVLKAALLEMQRQVGVLSLDEAGIAHKGLLVRHLVLPNGLAGTKEICEFISGEISPDTYINIMDQYRPCYQGIGRSGIERAITRGEYDEAREIAKKAGLHNFL